MKLERYLKELEEHLNIPDETDEEYLARMREYRRQKRASKAKQSVLIEPQNSPADKSTSETRNSSINDSERQDAGPSASNEIYHVKSGLSSFPSSEGRDVAGSALKTSELDHSMRLDDEIGHGGRSEILGPAGAAADCASTLVPVREAGASVKRKTPEPGLEEALPGAKKVRLSFIGNSGHRRSPLGADRAVSHDSTRSNQHSSQVLANSDDLNSASGNVSLRVSPVDAGPLGEASSAAYNGQPSGGVASMQDVEMEMGVSVSDAHRSCAAPSNTEPSRSHMGRETTPEPVSCGQPRSAVDNPDALTPSGSTPVKKTPLKASTRRPKVVLAETPARKTADKSSVTTPGDNDSMDETQASEVGMRALSGLLPKTVPQKTTKVKTVKLQRAVTKDAPHLLPPDFARYLIEQFSSGALKCSKNKFLDGKCIFYCSSDFRNATEGTQARMTKILRYGGTLLPEFDNKLVTHIVVDASIKTLLRRCGLQKLTEIREDVPILTWKWIGTAIASQGRLGYYHLYAAFNERVLYNPEEEARIRAAQRRAQIAKEKRSAQPRCAAEHDSESEEEYSRISEFTMDKIPPPAIPNDRLSTAAAPRRERTSTNEEAEAGPSRSAEHDPLAEFYEKAREEAAAERHEEEQGHASGQPADDPTALPAGHWDRTDETDDDSDDEAARKASRKKGKQVWTKRGYQCDKVNTGPTNDGPCPNQDVIDKLKTLQSLHAARPAGDDSWRVRTYSIVIASLRRYPKRIASYEEALKIQGVGTKTAQKIMEIIQTGDLRRIAYTRTPDVVAATLFTGIYGVGTSTAYQWYQNGCRTLEDLKAGKGGVKLNAVQKIGLEHYDDINTRMPREEAQAIFDLIKPIALSMDPKLFVEIMGSFRRGRTTCGDIDILITRPTEDGKTHAGILPRLLAELHKRGIITEDLTSPDDWHDLELVYRGLCRKDNASRRRRIDFLTVPYESRGAALLYYTGSDIFNRSMRLKANYMGYSLNQKGLFADPIRNPSNRREKLDKGRLVASATEEEIFEILGVPWQTPQERDRT